MGSIDSKMKNQSAVDEGIQVCLFHARMQRPTDKYGALLLEYRLLTR